VNCVFTVEVNDAGVFCFLEIPDCIKYCPALKSPLAIYAGFSAKMRLPVDIDHITCLEGEAKMF